eukprot:m.452328 g.452328  ORF g.452328 m.452328 type:complete len:998 (+) comp21539_c0_seq2:36-3029(+)
MKSLIMVRSSMSWAHVFSMIFTLQCTGAFAFWPGECVRDPGPYGLPDNVELDCALRALAVKKSACVLGVDKKQHRMDLLLEALNMKVCSNTSSHLALDTTDWSNIDCSGLQRAGPHIHVARKPQKDILFNETVVVEYVVSSSNGTDSPTTTGNLFDPFATIGFAIRFVRSQRQQKTISPSTPVILRLRAGIYFESLSLTPADSFVTIASFNSETATLSGGFPIQGAAWQKTSIGIHAHTAYKTTLTAPLPRGFNTFTGLFRNGRRLTRARFPNCADITGTSCYTLNASGPAGKVQPRQPTHPLKQDSVQNFNLEVVNRNGVDMFADAYDSAPATGPNGASDGTLLNSGANKSIVVDHPDYAWRCHEDCGWVAYSKWRGTVCDIVNQSVCRMDSTYNEPYWDQQVSGAFHYNNTDASWTPRSWAHPGTGVVHMYHTARWGGWQFQLHSRNDTDHSLTFACTTLRKHGNATIQQWEVAETNAACPTDGSPAVVQGGWQEARGADIGVRYTDKRFNNSYFVENILEETDYPDEWFFDPTEGSYGTLYLVPSSAADEAANFTSGKDATSLRLTASIHKRVLQIIGNGVHDQVYSVGIANITIAHAALTYLDRFETPSGGDWAITRSAAVFLDNGVVGASISGCTFDQVDGNGVFFSRHVHNSSIIANDFLQLGETAMLIVGASGLHRTNQGNSTDYPAFNVIARNHVAGVGVWNKQSAAYFKSITRANVLMDNVFHDGPRSGINFNDGAMGGEVMDGNVLFNFVRESNDHGPFNSWDRQPYIYRVNEYDVTDRGGGDSTTPYRISPQTQVIRRNLVINFNFHGVQCGSIAIDFDDESSQYHVESNVLVYGGQKCFDGMDRNVTKNLFIYPSSSPVAGPACFHALSSTRNRSSAHTHFVNNHCVHEPSSFPYNCGAGPSPFFNESMHVDVDHNTFSFPGATAEPGWKGACQCYPGPNTDAPQPCPFETFADWQSKGHDVHSSIQLSLSNEAILQEAHALLGL